MNELAPTDAQAPAKREKVERAATCRPGRGPPEGSLAWGVESEATIPDPDAGEYAGAGEAGRGVEWATMLNMAAVRFSGSGGFHRPCGDGRPPGRD